MKLTLHGVGVRVAGGEGVDVALVMDVDVAVDKAAVPVGVVGVGDAGGRDVFVADGGTVVRVGVMVIVGAGVAVPHAPSV